jgi:drug/metabolite transporter (DMT)-like permease
MRTDRFGRPAALCLLAAVLFGASTPASKALLDEVGPLTLAGLLYLGGALGVLPWARRGGSAALRRDRRERLLLAGAVVFGGGLGPVLMLLGLEAAPSSSVSLWLNLETVATTLLAWAVFREHLDRRAWLAAALALVGGVALAAPGGFANGRAALLVAAACVCWGLDNNLTALIGGFTPAQTTLVKGLAAGAANLVLGLVFEGAPRFAGLPISEGLSPRFDLLALALVVGALSYGASITLYISGAQLLGASRSQLIFGTAPFLGTALSWIFLGEPVEPAQLLAAALMGAALVLLAGERHSHEHTHERFVHTHSHRHDDGHHDHVHPGPSPGISPGTRHTHEHTHEPTTHEHAHAPDQHHRHEH